MRLTTEDTAPRIDSVDQAEDVLMTNPTACAELERYWASLPRSNGVPSRKDVDPVAMTGMLEDSFILERVAPGVARIRVAGRNIGQLLGIEPRGLPITASFLPQARVELAQHIETAFGTPSLVELAIEAPRAVGQPCLQGKLIMLPLRDDHGRVSRMIGMLVMSGRRGIGGRRFTISDRTPARIDPIVGLHAVPATNTIPLRPSLLKKEKADDKPALRLVVSNS